MKIYRDIIQGTPEWFQLKLGMVSASRFKDALAGGKGKSKRKYMLQLLAERMTGQPVDSFSSEAMERGIEVEAQAREYYEALNNCKVEQVGFIELDENIGCSPDGLVGDEGLIEIKCPKSTTHIDTLLTQKVPTEYMKQIQGQMYVSDRQWCDFVSFDPRVKDRPFWSKRVMRDEKLISELEVGIEIFVQDMLEMEKKLTNDQDFC